VRCRPYCIVEGVGFRHLADKFIEIGAKYGKIPAKEILPVATTVSRHLSDMYMAKKGLLKLSAQDVPSFGVTCDGWTHESTNVSYITVTVHYVSSDWKLANAIIATRQLNESHTADCIRSTVMEILSEFDCQKHGNVYVTDNASNMKAAFGAYTWIGCSGHNLNLVLSHGLQLAGSSGLPNEIGTLINTCKQLVTLMKRTKLNNQLETTLKQCVVTRWNSILTMLNSLSLNLVDLRQLTASGEGNQNLMRLLADVDEQLLHDVIEVLKPFDSATKLLSADHRPTIHQVVAVQHKLRCQIAAIATDTVVIQSFKAHMTTQLDKYFTVTDFHRVALLLDPRLKLNTTIISAEERARAINFLEKMVDEKVVSKLVTTTNVTDMATEAPPLKKVKVGL